VEHPKSPAVGRRQPFTKLNFNGPAGPGATTISGDGMHRQAIARGRVAYEPNSLGGGCPFQAGARGFVSFPKGIDEDNGPIGDKVRGQSGAVRGNTTTKPPCSTKARPRWSRRISSAAFVSELSKVTVPGHPARDGVLASQRVRRPGGGRVADGLGIELPEPMPRATNRRFKPGR